jgi:hypothetical protein
MRALHAAAVGAAILPLLASAAVAGDSVRWKTVIGIMQAGNVVAGVPGGGQPWSTLGGDARVDLERGRISFDVKGLVLAGGNTIGTPGAVTQVKGTLVCGAGSATPALVDTPLVALSPQGDAEFDGAEAPLPAACANKDLAFLVRIAAGRWIANGAVRSP